MATSIQRDVGTEQSSCTDLDFARVDDGRVEVEENVISQLYVGAVVDVDWGFDPGFLSKEFFICLFSVCLWR